MRFTVSVFAALSLASAVFAQSTTPRPTQGSSSSQPQAPSQASSGAPANQPSPAVTTVYSNSIGFGPNRQEFTTSVAIVSTITPSNTPQASGGSGTASAGGTPASTNTTPTTYATAATTVDVAAGGGSVAPSPGGSNPAYGPDDKYISGAMMHTAGGLFLALGLGLAIFIQ